MAGEETVLPFQYINERSSSACIPIFRSDKALTQVLR
jgi:hypothetical protein